MKTSAHWHSHTLAHKHTAVEPDLEAEVQHELRVVAERGGRRLVQVLHLLIEEGARDALHARDVVAVAVSPHAAAQVQRGVKDTTDLQARAARGLVPVSALSDQKRA